MASSSDKQLLLEEHLRGLSGSALDSVSIEESITFFLNLYDSSDQAPSFRHSYSSISLVVYGGILPSTHEEFSSAVRNAQGIASNLDQIVDEMGQRDCGARVMGSMRKLSDHVRLEMQRLTTFESIYSRIGAEADEMEKKLEDAICDAADNLNGMIEDQKDKLEEIGCETEENSEKARREYVTILGIFAAVVIAFMSGTAFSSSVLQNIDNASIYRLSFVILVLGFFLLNLLVSLFAFLGKMTNNSLFRKGGRNIVVIAITADVVMVVLIGLVVWCRFNNVVPPIC